ncbi:hypothetical protein Tco_0552734 [Tanacetum coccineum]
MVQSRSSSSPYSTLRTIRDPGNPHAVPPTLPSFRTHTLADLNNEEKLELEADAYAMNCILLDIPNIFYTTVDSCKTTQAMWQRVRCLMQGIELSTQDIETNLCNEFDKFTSMLGESLESYYHRFAKVINDHEHEEEANEVKAERAAKHHDLLALVAHTQIAPQPSSTPQPYYVSHPPDEEENQIFDFHNAKSDNLVENLNKAMMLLAREFTMSYARPTNNRVTTSSNTHYPKPMVKDSNYFKEQVLLAKKDDTGIDLTEEENDFLVDVMLDEEVDEFNATCVKMARIQETTNIDSKVGTSYATYGLSDVPKSKTCLIKDMLSSSVQERHHIEKLKTINKSYMDDQIDSN